MTDTAAHRPGFFKRCWRVLDASRRLALNLFFLLVLLTLLVAAVAALWRGQATLKDNTALVLGLQGRLVEQRSGSLRGQLFSQAGGQSTGQLPLRDVLAVLEAAAKDPKITRAVLMLDDFQGGGQASLHEVAAAIERFKAAGKPVIAWGSNFDQKQYFLAAHASEVQLHPMGVVYVDGFGRLRNYYRDLFDRIGVSANVIRVGKYKNFGEPFFADGPSKETQESDAELYGALWAGWTAGVERARKLPAGSIQQAIETLPQGLAAAGNDAARLALQLKWVDALVTRDQLRDRLVKDGIEDKDKHSFVQIGFNAYLRRIDPPARGDAVGVIVAEGQISDGEAAAGAIGGLSTAALVRKARFDERIKAVVLRVDSPGGSGFGSELIRRELELLRAAGKPVVVSMGDVAASGGYWIAMAADEVIADPATITGSIGVFAILPTAEGLRQKLSVNTEGYSTTWLGNAYDPRLPLDPRFADMVQALISQSYAKFIGIVATARKTTPEKIDAAGQGRVWTGTQALERGLVDRTGSLGDALKSAAQRGQLPETFVVRYVEPEAKPLQRLLDALAVSAVRVLGPQLAQSGLALGTPPAAVHDVQRELLWLNELMQARKPFAAVVHCLCEAP